MSPGFDPSRPRSPRARVPQAPWARRVRSRRVHLRVLALRGVPQVGRPVPHPPRRQPLPPRLRRRPLRLRRRQGPRTPPLPPPPRPLFNIIPIGWIVFCCSLFLVFISFPPLHS